LAATCDGSIQVLDPFRGQMVYRYAQPKETLPFAAIAAMPSPSTNILAATNDGVVRSQIRITIDLSWKSIVTF